LRYQPPIYLLRLTFAAAEVLDLFSSRLAVNNVGTDSQTVTRAFLDAAGLFAAAGTLAGLGQRARRMALSPVECLPPGLSGYSEGALLVGVLLVDGEATLELMDPRGHNPPFGRYFERRLSPGDLAVFWAGQPFAIPPPRGGAVLLILELGNFQVFDFEADPLA